MTVLRTYHEDMAIAHALIRRDEKVTKQFYYQQCYPLFKSIYDRYYTNCNSCKEFMDEIYLLIMTPGKKTGRCQLENYRGESSLMTWLKVTSLYYSYAKFGQKNKQPIINPISESGEERSIANDRIIEKAASIKMNFENIERSDLETLLNMMPNKRYRQLLWLRYISQYTNEETAKTMGMSMENYYNNHKRAKEQFFAINKEEENNE